MADKVGAASAKAKPEAQQKQTSELKEVKLPKVSVPDLKELLKAGVQFGHEVRRWSPKMAPYIFGAKNNIHIIDITQTAELLQKSAQQLQKMASEGGTILFVGTKRQAAEIVKKYAIEAGAYYITGRWVGGFFTNSEQVHKSLRRLRQLETAFEEGVEGRTKYEISRMKVEWQRLNRLYEGVKNMQERPVAVVLVDPRFERATVRECRVVHVPVFSLTDTNCDPDMVDYIIPGNDDAIGSIEIVMKTLAEAIKTGNAGKGVKHDLKDYTKAEVKIVKSEDEEDDTEAIGSASLEAPEEQPATTTVKIAKAKPAKAPIEDSKPKAKSSKRATSDQGLEGGILGRSRNK